MTSKEEIRKLLDMERPGLNWVIPGRVSQGVYPYGYVKDLVEQYKVTRIMNLTEFGDARYEPVLYQILSKEKVKDMVVYMYVSDYGVPSLYQLTILINQLVSWFNAGENIYIHCQAGRGRSTIVSTCLLGRLYNLDADDALKHIRRAYRRKRGDHRIPETEAQEDCIREYLD